MRKIFLLSLFLLLSACARTYDHDDRMLLYGRADEEAICIEFPERCVDEGVTW